MARGDVVFFNQFMGDLGRKLHDLDNDTFNYAIVDNSTVLAATTADPRWGAGGTTNLSLNEVATGTAYTGPAAATIAFDETAGTITIDFTVNPNIAQDAGGFADGYYLVVYNNTDAGKRAACYMDLGGPVGNVDGPLVINWNASGALVLARP